VLARAHVQRDVVEQVAALTGDAHVVDGEDERGRTRRLGVPEGTAQERTPPAEG